MFTTLVSTPARLSGREDADKNTDEVPVIGHFRGSRSSGGTRRSSPKSSKIPNTDAPIIRPMTIRNVITTVPD